jgi:hypothetical protein
MKWQKQWRTNMIYFIGGAPRVGKSILCQQVASKMKIGWISTDLLMEVLRAQNASGIKSAWNATQEAIVAKAEWFFPYLERFVWGVNSMADSYVIEGVDFLPAQVQRLSSQYPIRSVFLGCRQMTLEKFDQFPGRSPGYSFLPDEIRRQIAEDVPQWSAFIQQEADHFGYRYVDMANDFDEALAKAETILTTG